MLALFNKTHVVILLAAVAVLALWSTNTRPVISATPIDAVHYSDLKLYQDIAQGVAQGENYYSAATRLQREHHYPNSPFLAVRLPTLAFMAALLGWPALHALLLALALVTGIAAARTLEPTTVLAERVGIALATLVGIATLIRPEFSAQHEIWVGLLVAIALFTMQGKAWPLAVASMAGAVLIRELAVPFALLAGVLAAYDRQWRQATIWAGLCLVFGLAMVLHARALAPWVQPGDMVSQGWSGLRGPGAALRDLIKVSLLSALPERIAGIVVLLPLLGWLAAPARLGAVVLTTALGYIVLLSLFARDQNYYWALVMLPWWFVGFALVPRAIGQMTTILRLGKLPPTL